ncbi:MAG: metal-dependent hydrolase [Candidatus Nanopusillus sp.]|nr:metal-dependent hydrolase [Candidatus Nanopusillus sp.]
MIIKLHQALSSFITYLMFFYIFNFDKASSIIISIIVGLICIIPDYDYKIYNWANKQYENINKSKILKYLLYPYYLFILFLLKLFKHRGFTHSIFPIIIFFFMGLLIMKIFYLFSLAFLLHIIEDSLTVSGITPFYPISNYKFAIPILNNRENRKLQEYLSYIIYIMFFVIIFL